jgi:hypothetical protein
MGPSIFVSEPTTHTQQRERERERDAYAWAYGLRTHIGTLHGKSSCADNYSLDDLLRKRSISCVVFLAWPAGGLTEEKKQGRSINKFNKLIKAR